ncbi:MAG TPA: MFS transporter [Phycisphaerae bacterium]|nr:MFS transporter [Phycisphaerae bacterium]
MPDPSQKQSAQRGLWMLAISILCLNFGLAGHMSMNANFLQELIHVTPWQMGYLEAVREACGIASFALIAVLAGMAEPSLAAAMLLLVGVGLTGYVAADSVKGVIAFSVIWSVGFHLWIPLSTSMTLAFARAGHAAERLGQMRAVGAVGSLLGLGAIVVLASGRLPAIGAVGMRYLFVLCGCVVLVAAIASSRITGLKRPSVVKPWAFKRRYALYYLLSFLEGWRKQIFLSFATFALVREYGAPVYHIATLMFINLGINLFLAPTVGRWIDRVGERAVLSMYYPTLAVVFVLYALIPYRTWLYALYVVDNVLFVLALALPSYLNRVADPDDRRQCLAMGVTMNHIAAVLMPLVGGMLWQRYGYQIPFYCGAAVALVSLMVCQKIATAGPLRAPSPPP